MTGRSSAGNGKRTLRIESTDSRDFGTNSTGASGVDVCLWACVLLTYYPNRDLDQDYSIQVSSRVESYHRDPIVFRLEHRRFRDFVVELA
jgi:hypothetical protein